jgi:N-acetylglutamate synthase-like GNAT family acetyltransferase
MPMTAAPQFVTRRATVDDLPQLISLWQLEQLPAEALEKRLTEFQIVSDDAGRVLAALGFQISGAQGLVHSECIAQPEIADTLRELLWKRLYVMIQNHALERLWTPLNVPFWREKGFERAHAEQLAALPAQFADAGRDWQVKTLRAATASAVLEREFAQLKALQQQEAAQMQHRVRWMKRLALIVTVIVFILIVVWAVTLFKLGPRILQTR